MDRFRVIRIYDNNCKCEAVRRFHPEWKWKLYQSIRQHFHRIHFKNSIELSRKNIRTSRLESYRLGCFVSIWKVSWGQIFLLTCNKCVESLFDDIHGASKKLSRVGKYLWSAGMAMPSVTKGQLVTGWCTGFLFVPLDCSSRAVLLGTFHLVTLIWSTRNFFPLQLSIHWAQCFWHSTAVRMIMSCDAEAFKWSIAVLAHCRNMRAAFIFRG